MIATGLVLAGLAALLHVYIFTMESLTWTSEATRARFGTTPEQAAATREMAYNQGFYNLFLALTTIVGIALVVAGQRGAGAALVLSGAGSMALAGLVLLLSSPDKRRAALTQLTAPALGVIALVIGLV
jgi:putative membrane protein